MTTVFVDLVNLDGSRPEGSLRFSLERLVLGDPDVVPSAVDVKIRDGKARVEGLLPGAMRVRVNAGCWSKDWHIEVPSEGEHDLFELLEWQAEDFQETVWAELNRRVEALEARPEPAPFNPAEMRAEIEELRARLDAFPPTKPVGLTSRREFDWDLASPLFEIGGLIASTIWMGRVDIAITVPVNEDSQRVLKDGVYLAGVPAPANVPVSRAMTAIGQDGTIKDITRAGLRAEFVSGKIRFYDRGSAPGGVFGEAIERGDKQIKIQFIYYTEDKY